MIPTFDSSFDFNGVSERLAALTAQLAPLAPKMESSVRLNADETLPTPTSFGDQTLYVVREGCLHIRYNDKVVLMLEEGECVFPPHVPLSLTAPDFSVAVDTIPFTSLMTESGETKRVLAEVLEFYAQLWLRILADIISSSAQVIPTTRVFQSGETIITQGDPATEVYTLIEGAADVFVDGVKVGEVQTEEFFGILASITRAPRTATVVAKTNCAVLCVPTGKFQELIRARPILIEKLVSELSRMVVNLNGKVVELSRSTP